MIPYTGYASTKSHLISYSSYNVLFHSCSKVFTLGLLFSSSFSFLYVFIQSFLYSIRESQYISSSSYNFYVCLLIICSELILFVTFLYTVFIAYNDILSNIHIYPKLYHTTLILETAAIKASVPLTFLFLIMQISEYMLLVFYVYSIFYALTGLHFFHVIISLWLILLVSYTDMSIFSTSDGFISLILAFSIIYVSINSFSDNIISIYVHFVSFLFLLIEFVFFTA